ncbi:hypothetical protein HDV06_006256 [Boothiomyces sp. JEL0866]|nr:hypothetical protein HDV06_006256 [Boothiomyces sp. JEL0866]
MESQAYAIPIAAIFGIALQKNFQIVQLAIENSNKNLYFWASAICSFLNGLGLILSFSVIQSADTQSGSFYVDVANLKKTFAYKILFGCNVMGLLLHIYCCVLMIAARTEVVLGLYPNFLAVPYAPLFGNVSVFALFAQAWNYVTTSVFFLYGIASKLQIKSSNLLYQLIVKHCILDYALLFIINLNMCVSILMMIRMLSVSPVYASFVFLHSSLVSARELLQESKNQM